MPELQQPDIVGNFLSSYATAQAQQQAQQDREFNKQRIMKQDSMAEQKFGMDQQAHQFKIAEEVVNMLGSVQDGDAAGFERAKQRWGQMGLPPEAVAGYTVADLPALRIKAGTQLRELQAQQARAQIAAANRSNQGGGGSGVLNNAMQRAQLAEAFGIDPASPAGQKFALTGQLPAPLSATDKKAVLEADQMARATKEGLGALRQARVLSGKASQGWGANTISQGLSLLGDETAVNTLDFDNIIKSNVLPQLKVIFGGAPTEGERAILLELQGSSSLSRENRQRILDRAIKAAEDRLQFYNSQAQDLRGGTYYSPTRGQQSAPAAAPTQNAPQAAKKKWTTPEGFTIEEVD